MSVEVFAGKSDGWHSLVDDHVIGGSPSIYPPYPAMLSGWSLQASQIDTTSDQGWTYTTGVTTRSAVYNRAQNVQFGQGPDSDAMLITVTYDTTATYDYYGADAEAKFCPLPDTHVVEFYSKTGPLGNGAHSGFWERPLSTGEGELDIWEFFGGVWGANHSDSMRLRTNTIVTPYSSPILQNPTAIEIDGQNSTTVTDITGWHHFRYRKTTTDVTVWVDGEQRAQIVRGSGGNYTDAEWDTDFASGHTWYFRANYDYGINPTSGDGYTAYPADCPTELWVRDIKIWEASA